MMAVKAIMTPKLTNSLVLSFSEKYQSMSILQSALLSKLILARLQPKQKIVSRCRHVTQECYICGLQSKIQAQI